MWEERDVCRWILKTNWLFHVYPLIINQFLIFLRVCWCMNKFSQPFHFRIKKYSKDYFRTFSFWSLWQIILMAITHENLLSFFLDCFIFFAKRGVLPGTIICDFIFNHFFMKLPLRCFLCWYNFRGKFKCHFRFFRPIFYSILWWNSWRVEKFTLNFYLAIIFFLQTFLIPFFY